MPAMTADVRRFRLHEWLTMSLWVAPAFGVVLAIALAEALVALDRELGSGALRALPLVDGGAESARTVLSVIAASMVTSISLIFSVTMVVLQLASAQYSPRVLASFIRDRLVQAVLAAYIGTFVYCLLVLPTVQERQPGEDEFVPGLAVTAALLWPSPALVSSSAMSITSPMPFEPSRSSTTSPLRRAAPSSCCGVRCFASSMTLLITPVWCPDPLRTSR